MDDVKKTFRKECLRRRNELSASFKEEENRCILEHLKAFQEKRKLQHYLCYIHYKSEVETIPFIQFLLQQGVSVYAPKVTGESMDFYKINTISDLQTGYQGILEPEEKENNLFQNLVSSQEKVCMILPGCGFDRKGNRIGYGGGYYDRYLCKWENVYEILKVAVSYEVQIVEEIPHQSHDHKVDCIITKKGCIKCLT